MHRLNACAFSLTKRDFHNMIYLSKKKDVEIMLKMILIGIGMVVALVGVIMVFDARKLTEKLFSFGDQNEGTAGMKIMGFILAMIGALLIYFNI